MQQLTRLLPEGRYSSARTPGYSEKKSMHKYFPAVQTRDKNPSQNKIKQIQSRPLLNSVSGTELRAFESDLTQGMKYWYDERKEQSNSKNLNADRGS